MTIKSNPTISGESDLKMGVIEETPPENMFEAEVITSNNNNENSIDEDGYYINHLDAYFEGNNSEPHHFTPLLRVVSWFFLSKFVT